MADNVTTNSLTPSEATDAAAVAALVFTSAALGRLLAFGTFFQLLSTIVMAVLASRRRIRVVSIAGLSAALLGMLLGGIGPLTQISAATLFGGATGRTIAKGRGQLAAMVSCLVFAFPPVALFTVGFLFVFTRVRELNFDNATNAASGMSNLLGRFGLDSTGESLVEFVEFSIEWWFVFTPLLQVAITIGYSIFTYRVAKPVISRVNATLGDALNHQVGEVGQPGPVDLDSMAVLRGDAVVATVDLHAAPGELVALTGPNGAGKSSTISALAGFAGSSFGSEGWNAVGLGRVGGTAVIGQRPDAQILAPRVRDELAWGGYVSDEQIETLLDQVGIGHLIDRDSSSLSGGEMQRLAIAAALSLEPSLLLSDESTSMLDPVGRAAVAGLLRRVADDGATVIHASHVLDDLAIADHTASIGEVRRVIVPDADSRGPGEVVLSARNLGVVHDAGSPWAVSALDDIDLDLREGQLTLLTGGNGSGKTTLAWTLAGLLSPTSGQLTFKGEAVTGPNLAIGLAFQHARLQLLNDKVSDEVKSLSGQDDVNPYLRSMGLDPHGLGNARVDQLSGGEQRRVLLAGLLGRKLDVVILDEPLAGLDGEGRERLRAAVHRFLASRVAVVIVSHEPDWAEDLVHQRITLRDGRIVTTEVRS